MVIYLDKKTQIWVLLFDKVFIIVPTKYTNYGTSF